LIRETYAAGCEDYFYTFTLQRGYIKLATNFPDEVLRDLKTLCSYTVNLMKIINVTEILEHIICLNFCTSNPFEQVIVRVRNSSYFLLLLSSQTSII